MGKKALKILFSPVFVLLFIFSAAFVYAQFNESDSYVVKTTHIFPSHIVAKDWENAESLVFQNLDDYALYQEFNSINSATIKPVRSKSVETKVKPRNDSKESGVSGDSSSEKDFVDTGTDAEDTVDASDESVTATSSFGFGSETNNSTTDSVTDSEDVLDDSETEVEEAEVVETEAEEETEESEPEPEPETEEEPVTESESVDNDSVSVSQSGTSLFSSVIKKVTSSFLFAQMTTNTSTPETSEEFVESEEVSEEEGEDVVDSGEQEVEEVVEEDVVGEEEVEDEVVSQDEEEVQSVDESGGSLDEGVSTTTEEEVVNQATSTEEIVEEEDEAVSVVDEDEESGQSEAGEEMEDETEVDSGCVDDCHPYSIALSDFSLPIDSGVEVSGAQLRLSFAAKKKNYRDEIPMFEVKYSVDDGDTWLSGGAIIIDDESSNSINGGYYLFSLPEVVDEESLNNLKVELVYEANPAILKDLYVESVWLELFTLEAPENSDVGEFADLIEDDGFKFEKLSGDTLELPDGTEIELDFTDENSGETLIIKSDKPDYVGLTKTTTYFSVTNESNRADDFHIQTYFPKGVGEVESIREYNQNKPKKVVIPEYRPFVYHCEAGWEFNGEVTASSLQELSQQFSKPVVEVHDATQEEVETVERDEVVDEGQSVESANEEVSDNEPDTDVSEGDVEQLPAELDDAEEEDSADLQSDTGLETEVGSSDESAEDSIEFELESVSETGSSSLATTTAYRTVTDLMQLVQFTSVSAVDDEELVTEEISTTLEEVDIDDEGVTDSAEDTDESEENLVDSYICRNTSVIRTCDSVDGDNTACHIDNKLVAEHEVVQYNPGWEKVENVTGAMPEGGLFKKVASFIGFGPDKKEVKDGFDARTHTEDSYTIEPGETKYFEMEISFPPFSTGEYWIEAVGDREYGLLDPFWSSQWRYKKPITINNFTGTALTEQQVFLEMTSAESDFWSNVQNDGGDIRFIRETPGDDDTTWYDQNWDNRLPIVIDSAAIDDDLTDFPVYVDLADLGSSFFTEVDSAGADIRITTGDAITEVPYELVDIDTGAQTGELHFKADSLSSTTDTTFYIYYGNGAASAYAADDPYGAENVWNSDFNLVYHLEEDSAGAGNSGLYTDSTTNGYDGDDEITSTGKSGKIGSGQEIRSRETNPDDHILIPVGSINSENVLSFSFWLDTNQNADQALSSAGPNNILLLFLRNTQLVVYDDSANDTFTLDTDVTGTGWNHFTIIRDGDNNEWRLFINGVEDNQSPISETLSSLSVPADCFMVGGEHDTCAAAWDQPQELDGYIDEYRIMTTAISSEWAAATYDNQNDTSSFYSTSTVEAFTPTTFTELDYWIQHFDYTGQETDIWVQVDTVPDTATSTIYIYYGNPTADTTSDEYAPFTYSTSTDLYYVVSDLQTNPIVVYSLIDDNEVSIDGNAPVSLNSGETTSFATYSSSSVISALGPITAKTSDALSEPPVPISFATTTNLVTTNRTSEVFYVQAPFADADVEIYEGSSGTPSATGTVTTGNADSFAVNLGGSNSGILESDEPVLLFHSGTNDSYVAYPPTTRPIFGVYSSQYNYAAIGATDATVFCSDGSSNGTTTMTRGIEESGDFCNGAQDGLGDGVMLTGLDAPIAATQEADGDGGESTRFLPTPEFGTRYIMPQNAEYITVVCSPRLGTSTIEVQTSAGVYVDGGTCSPAGANYPGVLNITPGTQFSQGYQVVSTDNVPFYMYYEEDSNGDETNTWSSVQAKKFNSLYFTSTYGAEEENEDAQYEQLNFRFYENVDSDTPTTPWDIDGSGAGEGENITDQGAINPGDEIRLRMNLLANNGTGTVSSTAFDLQYAMAETCSSVVESSWKPLADIGSTTAVFAGFDNASVGDGATLPSTLLSDSDVTASYEEENTSATLPNEVGNGEAVEFDWSITPVNVVANTQYCFRMIRSTEEPLTTYTAYPQVLTAGPPETPVTVKRFDNEHASSTSPTFRFAAVDQGGDDLHYQIQISTDNTFGSTVVDSDSSVDFLDFVNINNGSDKAPFDNGQQIEYTTQATLVNGTTYWWRVRASDPDGSNTSGSWSTPQSFTIDTSVSVSEWFQTTDEQFETNSLINATTSGSDSLELSIAGSNLIGEYGTVSMTNGATSTVNLNNSYTNPVVVASIRYHKSVTNDDQPAARVFNKTATSFDVLTDNYSSDAPGTSTVDYMVMEAGEYLIDDGADGLRVFATSTSVSAYDGSTIASDPGGLDITFPTSFSTNPVVLSMVTTINDPDWVVSTVYDGNDIGNPPTASQVSLFLNDNVASDGHLSAEDIDIIAFDKGDGSNNGVDFSIGNTGVTATYVSHVPYTYNFTTAFSSAPGVTLVSMLTTNGAQGGYAMVDLDTPATATGVTVAAEEGGPADRSHADEDVGIVAFADSSGDIIRAGTAQVVSTPIDFDDAEVGNAWGEVSWNDTGDVTYRVEYQTGSGFELIPDEDLPNNSTGFTGSSVVILDLDTDVYNEIRLRADLSGINPEIYDWTVKWGQRVEIPELGDLFDNEKTADTTPTFDFISSDPQGDDLSYEISISTDPTFAGASTTVSSQASSSDFYNVTDGNTNEPYDSGDRITYTVPAGMALSDNTTYWWRVRAKDPSGANSFSPWSNADSFTVDTTTSLSTWFQTTQAQFSEGVIDGVIASTSDMVTVTNEVGEYATTTVTANSWTTIDTQLTYEDMVVVASPEFAHDGSSNGRTVQVRNKTADSFEIRAENDTESLGGTTVVHYLAIEAGDWLLEDGGAGLRMLAGTAEDVSNVESAAYDGVGGTTVTFSPAFSSAPEAILTVSSANNNKWVGTAVSANGSQGTEITTNSMDVSMGVSRDLDTVRVAEDIDYVVYDTGTGENNSVLFDALRGTGVGISDNLINYNQTFSSEPGVTLVHNNANDGSDGAFAQKETGSPSSNTQLNVSVAEMGDGAGAHANENVSILAFEASEGTIIRDSSVSGGLTGTIASEPILFSDGFGPKFGQALFSASSTGSSSVTVQVQYQTATGSWALIPDAQIPNNSTGDTSGFIDLTDVNVSSYPVIRLLGTLTCGPVTCPELYDWSIEWSEGVPMSGTLKQYDRSTNVASATVTVSINGSNPVRTGTVTAGVWTINNVTAFAGDTVTVFVSDVPDDEEAVAVFIYDGTGDMTGVEMFEGHLSLSADENSTTTISGLSQSDNSSIVTADEDVFFDVDVNGDLILCAVGDCENANLYIGSGNVFIPSTSTNETIEVHDLVNNGVVELDGNTLELSGSWDNNSTVRADSSTVVFNATTGVETIDDSSGTSTFNNVTFGESSGAATWQLQNPLDVDGSLSVNYGTLERYSYPLFVAGALNTGSAGYWSGIGTTTFDGSGSAAWTDSNAVSQNIGYAVIDGSARTVAVGSDVLASSIYIGANDTLNGGGAYDIQVSGDFTNTNTFLPSSSRLVVIGTSTDAVVTTNGSSLYAVRASSTGGSIAFTESSVTLLDNLEIATGTVTLPTTLLRVGGSFSNTGGTFAHNNAEVLFNGSGSETIELQGTVFLNAFYDVRFGGSGTYTFLDTNATTSNTLTINNGAVVFPTGQLSVSRDFITNSPGQFDANGGEVLFLARSTDPITASGSEFNDVRVQASTPIRGGGFDSQWLYRDVVTINSTEIDDDLSDFPVYLDLADFSSDFFTNIKADGGDIRVTLSDGETETAREIVDVDTGLETGEMYFLAPSLSSTTNSTFYIYYGNATATDYAIDDTYGAENVWDDDFLAVYHMENEDAVDSTSFDRDATASGNTPTTATGKIGTAVSIGDDGGSDYLNLNSNFSELDSQSAMTVSTWVNVSDDSNDDVIFTRSNNSDPVLLWDNISGTTNNDTYTFSVGNTGTGNRVDAAPTGIAVGDTWQYVAGVMQTSNRYIYVDGVLRNTQTGADTPIPVNTNGAYIGYWTGSTNFDFDGLVDEYRISRTERDASWLAAEFSNMSTSTGFYSVSSGAVSPARIFSEANVTVTGDINIDSGVIQFPSTNLNVGGSFANNGTFNAGSGAVTFNATGTGHTISAGSSTFATLNFDGSGGGWTVDENATATLAINLNDGNDLTIDPGVTLETLGTFFNDMDNASTTWTGSVLKLSSGGDMTINNKNNGGDFYATIDVDQDADIKMWNSSSSVYSTNDTSSIYSQDHSGVDGDLYIFGDYVRTSGTEYWSYATDFDGTALGTSSRQVAVRIASGANIVASSSSLSIMGSSTATTSIDAQSGTYSLSLEGATLDAGYFTMTGSNASGLNLTASTTVSNFDNFEFAIGGASSAITVDASTIDTNPGAQFFNTDFVTAGGSVNVTLSGSPSSFWWFRDGAGDRYGEAFDNADGNPGSVRWDDSSYSIAVSGTVYADDGSSTLGGPTCDGATNNVRIVVDGGTYTSATSCSGLDGSYSFPAVSYIGDPKIVVYLDTNGGVNGSVITKTPTADITDLNIYANRVMTRHEDVDALTIADMTSYDENDDTDLRFVAATGTPDTLIVRSDTELIIASSTTFTPGGNVTLQSSGSGAGYDGSLHIDEGASFVASGNEIHTIGGSFFSDASTTFSSASSTFLFTATTSGKGITNADLDELVFNELTFNGVGGGWNTTADLRVLGDMTITNGTVSGTGDINIPTGTLGGNGVLSMGGGEVVIASSTTLGGTSAWTFYDLTLGDGLSIGTTTRSNNATTTVLNQLTISNAHFLDTGSSIWELQGGGNVLVEDGTLLEDTSTFVYSGTGATNVLSTGYYNLTFAPGAGTPTYTFSSVGVPIAGDLVVTGAGAADVNLNTNDPVVAVAGDVFIDTNGAVSASDSADLTVSGSWDNNGSLNGNSGTVVFDSADAYTIAAGNSAFANVAINGAGLATVTENATTSENMTLSASSTFTVNPGVTLAVGGQFSNLLGGVGTTWAGSTLHLFGGDDYQINAKTITDSYDTISVGANTAIRTWNLTATTTNVTGSGSLYSQDHNGVDGDLYIYGGFNEGSRTDYWSYDTDFDGTDLSGGSERQVDVYVAGGSSVRYSGSASVSANGTTTASTTIQNQGAGVYGLRFGGSAGVDFDKVVIRDLDPDGVVFSGAPSVTDFSRVDLLAQNNSDSTMTVGGTAISANPAKNFVGNIFNYDTGVTGAVNVTATGTTFSAWRFATHVGNLDGEANNVDPGGNPGYIIWDDSDAIIAISGFIYENDESSVSSVCDDSTANIKLAIDGIVSASSSCSSADGSYSVTDISFSANDTLTLFIDGESDTGSTVSIDPISSIIDMNIYEDHVIVRHEGADPISIADMSVYDSSDDADIPFTAVTGAPDTLTLPADTKLIVWTNKEFEPNGNVTVPGGGAGASYDGSFEAFAGAEFTAQDNEYHTIGGSFEFAPTAVFTSASSTIELTTTGAARVVDINDDTFRDVLFSGSGSWTISGSDIVVDGNLDISDGAVTLPTGTTTVGASMTVSGTGSFDSNSGLLNFVSTVTGNDVAFNNSDTTDVLFSGVGGSWTMSDTNATATNSFVVATGTVALPSGNLSVGDTFTNTGLINANTNTLQLTKAAGTSSILLSGEDLNNLIIDGSAEFTMVDELVSLLGDLELRAGVINTASTTLAIGGSLDATAGVMNTGSSTVLFNSASLGETIDAGNNVFYNVQFSGPTGGWTMQGATTTNNFALLSASNFTLASAEVLSVGGVMTNNVGGANTDWTDSVINLYSGTEYDINTSAVSGDQYNNIQLSAGTKIRMWNSSATTTTLATSTDTYVYSQDNAGVNGDLYIYGGFTVATRTEYWNYANDFDGTPLIGGSRRAVNTYFADENASLVLSGTGALNMVGALGATTSVQNLASPQVNSFSVTGGTLNASYYSFDDLDANGLNISGTPSITSLSNGSFTMATTSGNLITLTGEALNANASRIINETNFSSVLGGVNVKLTGTTTSAWRFTNESGNRAGEGFDDELLDTGCESLRWSDSSCLLTQQTGYQWRNDDGGEGVPDSEWFDGDWNERKGVRIYNQDGTTYASTTVQMTVAYDSDMQADFDDLRFTDSDGVTPISFWVEDYTASTEAVVWVEVSDLTADSVKEIYMYYDNVLANSSSSLANTFVAGDDFEDGNVSEYSGNTGNFSADTTYPYGGNNGLDVGGFESTNNQPGIYRTDQTIQQGQTIRFMQYVNTGAGANDEVCTMFAVGGSGANYGVCVEQYLADRFVLVENVLSTDSFGGVTVLDTNPATLSTGWYEVIIDWQTDDTIDAYLYTDAGSLVATTSASDNTRTSGGYGFTSWGQNGGWDSYVVYNRTETRPTVYFGASQTDGGATWSNAQNSPGTGFEVGDVARVRISVENSGLDITDQEFVLEYAPKGVAPSCEAVDSGDYMTVPNQASCGVSDICMTTSANYTSGDPTTDHLQGIYGEFVPGEIIEDPDNITGLIDIDQTYYTELEYAITPTINVSEDAYCFRVTDNGSALDSYDSVAQFSLAFTPVLGAISFNNGMDISLNVGTTTTILATTTVTDLNGYADLEHATATIYRSGAGAACSPDDNNCYVAGTDAGSCTFTNCAGNSCDLICSVDIAFHADATDVVSDFDGEEWLAYIEVEDSSGEYEFGSASGIELITLRALDVQNTIDYGQLTPNQDTGATNASTTVINVGNDSIDVDVEGGDLTDSYSSVIGANQQKIATSTFTYSACPTCNSLATSTGVSVELDLPKPVSTTPAVSDIIYWGIFVPFGTAPTVHQGTNILYAVDD